MITVRRKAVGLAQELIQTAARRLATSSGKGSRRSRPPPARAPPDPSAAGAAAAAQQAAPPAVQQASQPVPVGGDEWTEVVHQQTGLTYYWNQRTNETTALGEPRPGPEGRLQRYRQAAQLPQASRGGLGQLVAMGAGVGLVFALLSRVF